MDPSVYETKTIKHLTGGRKSQYVLLKEGGVVLKKYDPMRPSHRARYYQEVKILAHLTKMGCPFTPRLLHHDDTQMKIYQTYCGGDKIDRSDKLFQERVKELIRRLSREYGVKRYENGYQVCYIPGLLNVTRKKDKLYLIDFGSKNWVLK